ncbi:MAG: hypothetical protein DCC55_08475 [Chloroflexi bacterium]|nr:MAG: hypothetical protein DCC55_08475 [Chloroflexota bacterium]
MSLTVQIRKDTCILAQWVVMIRWVWMVLFSLTLLLFALGVYARFHRLLLFCSGADCGFNQLMIGEVYALRRLGISHTFYAWYHTALASGVGVIYVVTAAILFWRRSNHWMTIFVAAGMFMVPPLFYGSVVDALIWMYPQWYLPASVVRAIGLWFAILFSYLFPDGRFVPDWTRPLALIAAATACVSVLYASWSLSTVWRADAPLGPLFSFLLAGLLSSGLVAQVYRYRYVSSADERQQTKWMVLGLLGVVLEINAFALSAVLFPSLGQPGLRHALYYLVGSAINALFLLFWLATLVIAVLRYRLWEVDVIVRRTLVYTVLSALLALVYFGGIVLLENLFRGLTGQGNSQIASVLTTLAIAASFSPLRRFVQDRIDQRFYRHKYNEAQVVATFSTTTRHETDRDKLTEALLNVVQETLQPAQVSLWLRPIKTDEKRDKPNLVSSGVFLSNWR